MASDYKFQTGETLLHYSLEPLPIPYNSQQLTLRTSIRLTCDSDRNPRCRCSSLAAGVETLKSFISSPQHLVLDIDIKLETILDLTNVDFGPLVAVLGTLPPWIDLY